MSKDIIKIHDLSDVQIIERDIAPTSNVTDSDILDDLEYRGVDDLVADIQSGLFYVPESLVTRIKKIIEKEFSMDLVTGEISEEKESGHFCLLPFANQRQVQLVEK